MELGELDEADEDFDIEEESDYEDELFKFWSKDGHWAEKKLFID